MSALSFRSGPRLSRFPRVRSFLLSFAAVIAFVCFAASARAQSITVVNENSLPRLNAEGNQISKRPQTQEPEGVSNQDCIDGQQIQFTLQLAGFVGNASLEAWAGLSGADCKTQTNRSGGTQVCWNLVTGIPLSQVVNVVLPVRKIMSGVSPHGSPSAPKDDEGLCGQIDLTTIDVHFLYFAPGERATATIDKTLQVKVDTVGPAAPTGISVSPGNGRITVEWDNISGEGGVSVLTGVKVYCDPAGSVSDAAVEDAGQTCVDAEVDADAGEAGVICTPNDAGAPPSGDCTSSNLVGTDGQPRIPDADFNAKFQCGSFSGNSGTSVTATGVGGNPLTNGTRYAVAVAATDVYGNVGTLSGITCETPAPTTDFWEDYKNAGGGAGGGLCSTSGPGLPLGSLSVCAVFVFAALSSIRRAMRKRR